MLAHGDGAGCGAFSDCRNALNTDEGRKGNTEALMNVLSEFFNSSQNAADTAQKSMTSTANSVVNTVPAGIRQDPIGTASDVLAITGGTLAMWTAFLALLKLAGHPS